MGRKRKSMTGWEEEVAVFSRMTRVHLMGKVEYEQRPEGGEGVHQVSIRRKNILGRGKS